MKNLLIFCCALIVANTASAEGKMPKTEVELGEIIFFDSSLSNPPGQSCATCHNPSVHFASTEVVTGGAVRGRFGSRNAQSLKYVSTVPKLTGGNYEDWVGGLFWDGRVDSLEEQALKPFVNPLEMNNTKTHLAEVLRESSYIEWVFMLYGQEVNNSDLALIQAAAKALAAFQRSEIFTPFDSKYDFVQAGLLEFTQQELRGKKIFSGGGPGFGNCIDCHSGTYEGKDIFTQYIHHNILVPRNNELLFYTQDAEFNPTGEQFLDIGTANAPQVQASKSEGEIERAKGLFRTPTLRNIAQTAPYMHNGKFATLEEVIEFYDDIHEFGPSEMDNNKSNLLSTKLNLNEGDKKALVAFLNTLTDGYSSKVSEESAKKLREYQASLKKSLYY